MDDEEFYSDAAVNITTITTTAAGSSGSGYGEGGKKKRTTKAKDCVQEDLEALWQAWKHKEAASKIHFTSAATAAASPKNSTKEDDNGDHSNSDNNSIFTDAIQALYSTTVSSTSQSLFASSSQADPLDELLANLDEASTAKLVREGAKTQESENEQLIARAVELNFAYVHVHGVLNNITEVLSPLSNEITTLYTSLSRVIQSILRITINSS